jgi:ABC-type molybdate transport system substrate-binding protein
MIHMKSPWTAILGSVVIMGLLIALLARGPKTFPDRAESPQLFIYCGAGIRAPVDAAAKEYESDYGVTFLFQYGPSQTLVAQAELSKTGDLILPGDDTFIDIAREKDLIDQSLPLARMAPVLAVAKGNPKQVRSLHDLLQPGFRLAQPAADSAAAGRLVQNALQQSGDWEQIKAHTVVFKGTVNDVANDIKVGSVDAGFIWDVLLPQYPQLETVRIPQLASTQALVSVGSLKSSPKPSAARRFMRYLAAKDKGLRFFKEHGFEPADGEPWIEGP